MSFVNRIKLLSLREIVALVFGLTVISFVFYRYHFCVDWTDEGFFIAVPYRFALGDQPFIDQFLVYGADFLNFLWVKPYLLAFNSTEGIVLAGRYVMFAFLSLYSIVSLAILKDWIEPGLAGILALSFLIYVPSTIFGLGYNSYCVVFMTLGYLTSAQITHKNADNSRYLLPGFFHGLACFAYPPMISVVPVFFAIQLLAWRKFRGGWHYYFLGVITCAILFSSTVLRYGVKNYAEVFDFVNSWKTASYSWKPDSYQSFTGILKVVYGVLVIYAHSLKMEQVIFLSLFIFILFISRIDRRHFLYMSILLTALYPLLIIMPTHEFFTTLDFRFTALSGRDTVFFSNQYLYSMMLIGPVFIFLTRHDPLSKILFFAIWLPSLVAGFAVSFFSTTGLNGIGVGVFASSVATALAVILYFGKDPNIPQKFRHCSQLTFTATFVAILLLCLLKGSREDRGIAALPAKIQAGPFRGIYTYNYKKTFLDKLSIDVHEAITATDKTIVYAYTFPGLYLMTDLKPGVRHIWLSNDSPDSVTIDYFRRKRFLPDVIVVAGVDPGNKDFKAGRFAQIFTDDSLYHQILHREWSYTQLMSYSIYRKAAQESPPG